MSIFSFEDKGTKNCDERITVCVWTTGCRQRSVVPHCPNLNSRVHFVGFYLFHALCHQKFCNLYSFFPVTKDSLLLFIVLGRLTGSNYETLSKIRRSVPPSWLHLRSVEGLNSSILTLRSLRYRQSQVSCLTISPLSTNLSLGISRRNSVELTNRLIPIQGHTLLW